MFGILSTAHVSPTKRLCYLDTNKPMAKEVHHVYVEEEDFDSAVMESLEEFDIDNICGYLFEPEYSTEDLRCMELEEALLQKKRTAVLTC